MDVLIRAGSDKSSLREVGRQVAALPTDRNPT